MFRFLFIAFWLSVGFTSAQADVVILGRVNVGEWSQVPYVSAVKNDDVQLRVQRRSGSEIRWFQIFPDLSQNYKNANQPWEKDPYKWVGFDKISYHRAEIPQLRGRWMIELHRDFTPGKDVYNPTTQSKYFRNDFGSFWFQAEVITQGEIETSPGLSLNDPRGLSPMIFRVSLRRDEGFLGWVSSFINVPGVFGSVPYQSNNYIGVDSADLLMAAYGKWKGQDTMTDYDMPMLVKKFKKVRAFKMEKGEVDRVIRWGRAVKPGDIIAVRYPKSKRYEHVGVFVRDANGNGEIDGVDQVLHAGPHPPAYATLKEAVFDGHVVVLRP